MAAPMLGAMALVSAGRTASRIAATAASPARLRRIVAWALALRRSFLFRTAAALLPPHAPVLCRETAQGPIGALAGALLGSAMDTTRMSHQLPVLACDKPVDVGGGGPGSRGGCCPCRASTTAMQPTVSGGGCQLASHHMLLHPPSREQQIHQIQLMI
jgi:hypothetical protein